MKKEDWLNYLRRKKSRLSQMVREKKLDIEDLMAELKRTEGQIKEAENELKKERK